MAEMIISTPTYYVSKAGALNELGNITEKVTEDKEKKVLLVWSKTAKDKIYETVKNQLDSHNYVYEEIVYSGYPSEKRAHELEELGKEKGISAFIAFGGGKVLDVTKAAGNFSKIPVITVPTIAATCAGWAALSVLYFEDGDFDKGLTNVISPKAVIVDTKVIADAPSRYLKAGIVDTLAKWYEPDFEGSYQGEISKKGSKLAFDTLIEHGHEVINNSEKGIVDENTLNVIDSIIYLAGFVGSFVGDAKRFGLAHPFYNFSRGIPAVREHMHGEVVAYGLVLQAAFEKKSKVEAFERIKVFDSFDNLYTSEEIGLKNDLEKETVANRILKSAMENIATGRPVQEILDAFKLADSWVEEYRKAK